MTKDIVKNIQMCMAKNLPKFVISLLAMMTISTLMMAYTMVPIASAIMTSTMNIASVVMLIATAIAFSSIQYVLQYGFFVLVFLLYTGRYAVLGHLFSGFRDFKRAFVLGIVVTLAYVIVLSVIAVVLNVLISKNIIILELDTIIVILGFCSFIILAILYIHFAFTWFLLYENSRIGIKAAILKSIAITKGQVFSFVSLCIKSAGFYFPVALLCFLALQSTIFFPNIDITTTLFSIAYSAVNFLYFASLYISIMRFSISFAAWYVSYFDSAPAIEEIDKRIIHLPDYHDVSSAKEDTE